MDGLTHGLVLGKFMPPHAGHQFLCDFARLRCDRLSILVCSLPSDDMPGALRQAWMRELYPDCSVVWCDEEVPQEPADHPDFWPIWRDLIARHVGKVDAVFASEPYGVRLAQELSARFIPCDLQRLAQPISATQIRSAPFANWRHIPRPVRPYFARRVCVFGAESSGKTTLASALARSFGTIALPEYGRIWTETFGTQVGPDDLQDIALGHAAARAAALRSTNRVLIEDTDPILTCVWSDMLLGERAPWMVEVLDPADLYLLTDIDFDWVDDGTRYFSTQPDRERFHSLCVTELNRRGLNWIPLSGAHERRLADAVAAVEETFGFSAVFPP